MEIFHKSYFYIDKKPIFETLKIWGNSKIEHKELAQHLLKANIATRNYPTTVDELRKKLRIKEGGDTYLFACTIANERKVIIECRKYTLQDD